MATTRRHPGAPQAAARLVHAQLGHVYAEPSPDYSDPESDYSDGSSSSSSSSDDDDDIVNARAKPNWCAHRHLLEVWGFRLDTRRDVKQWYHQYWVDTYGASGRVDDFPGYVRACSGADEDDLCRDAGLPDHLFRGTQCSTGRKVVIKAVHLRSQQYQVIRYLSTPPLRDHPMNHCIPVLALIDIPDHDLGLIVMEEWLPSLLTHIPCTARKFLDALRQCVEHVVFMHSHHIAHQDISLHNILMDHNEQYACVDYELSRRYANTASPRTRQRRGTEVPPELERGEWSDPFKVDVWALGMLMMRSMKRTEYSVPELYPIIRSMLDQRFDKRPCASDVLAALRTLISRIDVSVRTPHRP